MKDIIKLENVIKIYNKDKQNEFQALNGVNLDIMEGDLMSIIGVSGSGKSTILHIISCLDSYEGGSCTYNGQELKNLSTKERNEIRNKEIIIILQDMALIPDDTVYENVSLPLMFNSEVKYKDIKEKTLKAIEMVGLEESFIKRKITELSGGQKQRVAIAKSLVSDPKVLLADEPTASLDKKSSQDILDLFKKINRESGLTVVIVTHDPKVAEQCDRIIEISDGLVVE